MDSSRRERKPTEKYAQYSLKINDQSKRKESKEKVGKE